jgi:hypothetical protein
MPPLFRLMLLHGAIGYLLAAVAVAGLLWFDHARLLTMMRADSSWPLPPLLLWLALGSGFGGVQVAVAVMALGEREAKPRGGGGGRLMPLRAMGSARRR